ncbi:MAG: hypothetical protein ABI321_16410 [Polyangia bacterium]
MPYVVAAAVDPPVGVVRQAVRCASNGVTQRAFNERVTVAEVSLAMFEK